LSEQASGKGVSRQAPGGRRAGGHSKRRRRGQRVPEAGRGSSSMRYPVWRRPAARRRQGPSTQAESHAAKTPGKAGGTQQAAQGGVRPRARAERQAQALKAFQTGRHGTEPRMAGYARSRRGNGSGAYGRYRLPSGSSSIPERGTAAGGGGSRCHGRQAGAAARCHGSGRC